MRKTVRRQIFGWVSGLVPNSGRRCDAGKVCAQELKAEKRCDSRDEQQGFPRRNMRKKRFVREIGSALECQRERREVIETP
jgi:hypothetical protein